MKIKRNAHILAVTHFDPGSRTLSSAALVEKHQSKIRVSLAGTQFFLAFLHFVFTFAAQFLALAQ